MDGLALTLQEIDQNSQGPGNSMVSLYNHSSVQGLESSRIQFEPFSIPPPFPKIVSFKNIGMGGNGTSPKQVENTFIGILVGSPAVPGPQSL